MAPAGIIDANPLASTNLYKYSKFPRNLPSTYKQGTPEEPYRSFT